MVSKILGPLSSPQRLLQWRKCEQTEEKERKRGGAREMTGRGKGGSIPSSFSLPRNPPPPPTLQSPPPQVLHAVFRLSKKPLAWFSDGPKSLALTYRESEWPRTVWESIFFAFHVSSMVMITNISHKWEKFNLTLCACCIVWETYYVQHFKKKKR